MLTIASWLSTVILMAALLIVQPLLAITVIAPAALLVHRRAEVARWRQIAMTDALTGLWNTYGWQQHTALVLTVGDARRPWRGPAVIMVDVDRFKAINDTHGHPTGDAVLRAVGTALTRAVRAGDLVVQRRSG